ncbi:hypothetical protein [Solidesulfovibrio sp. C21]|uniref:hypothetical protein n=1 Tax=Solidesulfovibrio sp. C21 TaxID=3398613 RepID=UPI0039FCD133
MLADGGIQTSDLVKLPIIQLDKLGKMSFHLLFLVSKTSNKSWMFLSSFMRVRLDNHDFHFYRYQDFFLVTSTGSDR